MSNLRVLIVEDNHDQAASLRAILGLHGFQSELAGSLSDTLHRLDDPNRPRIDCLVLDLTLPDATGVAAVIRLQAAHPETPVVVLTGHPDLGIPALHAGAQEVLLKPADPEVLMQRVEYAVARHEVRRKYEPYTSALSSAIQKVDRAEQGQPPA